MIIIAASLYLPQHITTVASRAWFYYAGDDDTASSLASAAPATHQQANGQSPFGLGQSLDAAGL